MGFPNEQADSSAAVTAPAMATASRLVCCLNRSVVFTEPSLQNLPAEGWVTLGGSVMLVCGRCL